MQRSRLSVRNGDPIRLSLRKRLLFASIAIAVSGVLLTTTLELILRVYHGKLFSFESIRRTAWDPLVDAPAEYHPVLGWVPNWNGRKLRDNGQQLPLSAKHILAVGDSFTFGEEVADDETWPAQLERLIQQPVLNAGVFAYGVDQAVLRAVLLLEEYDIELVLLGIIWHDIVRAELSFYYAWKPYFEIVDDRLTLRNSPVPRDHRMDVRPALGYSCLASAILRRAAPNWWHSLLIKKHDQGQEVTIRLLDWLSQSAQEHGVRLIVVTLGVSDRFGGADKRLPKVVAATRERMDVLDLATELRRLLEENPNRRGRLFRPRGHYSPEMNGWVAQRIAKHIRG